ncbi:hypothetical protein OfM1_11210 [Lactovum odontotermitis]
MRCKLETLFKRLKSLNGANYDESEQVGINNQLNGLKNSDLKNYSVQYKVLIDKLMPLNVPYLNDDSRANSSMQEAFERGVRSQLSSLSTSINTLIQLEPIAKASEGNIVLVGANGSGKSSFAEYLTKKGLFDSIVAIPAQKVLFFGNNYASNSSTPETIQQKQTRIELKNQEIRANVPEGLSTLLLDLIVAMINEETQKSVEYKEKAIPGNTQKVPYTSFDSFKEIFQQVFTGITFHMETSSRVLTPIRDKHEYTLNGMSDGEKVAIYFILYVLFAKKNSYIIVDEPETFLNPNISDKLWDLLEQKRSDCQFIYVTHNVEFINSRSNSSLFWLKSSNMENDSWDIELVEDADLPANLLVSLLGNKKRVMFCEGEDNKSLDYQLYEILFGKEYTVYPVGGCESVRHCTKTYNANKQKLFQNAAIGIIDYDLRSDDEIQRLKDEQVFVIESINEVEMAFFLPEILDETIKSAFPDDDGSLIQNFRQGLIDCVRKNQKRIITQAVKKRLEEKLSKEKLQGESLADLKENFLSLFTEKRFESISREITQKFKPQENDDLKEYKFCLTICSLKGEISGALSNEVFDDGTTKINYIRKAVGTLKKNKDLAKDIRQNYFPGIIYSEE